MPKATEGEHHFFVASCQYGHESVVLELLLFQRRYAAGVYKRGKVVIEILKYLSESSLRDYFQAARLMHLLDAKRTLCRNHQICTHCCCVKDGFPLQLFSS